MSEELKIGDEVKVWDEQHHEFSPITGNISAMNSRRTRVVFPPAGKSVWFPNKFVRGVKDTEKYCLEVTVSVEVGTDGARFSAQHEHGSEICEDVRLALELALRRKKIPYGKSGAQMESF